MLYIGVFVIVSLAFSIPLTINDCINATVSYIDTEGSLKYVIGHWVSLVLSVLILVTPVCILSVKGYIHLPHIAGYALEQQGFFNLHEDFKKKTEKEIHSV